MTVQMKAQFKVGDKVVRTGESTDEGVIEGKTYVVSAVSLGEGWLGLKGFERWGKGFNPELFELALPEVKFNPKVGDTIICENGQKYICVPIVKDHRSKWNDWTIRGEILRRNEDEFGGWQGWQGWYSDGTPYKDGTRCPYGYNIVQVLSPEESVAKDAGTTPESLEFRVRVLEKENELLVRLLLKGGLL